MLHHAVQAYLRGGWAGYNSRLKASRLSNPSNHVLGTIWGQTTRKSSWLYFAVVKLWNHESFCGTMNLFVAP